MPKCKSCGGDLAVSMNACPACGTEVELGRLTGILGLVCRACDAYNEPGEKVCGSCGKPIGSSTSLPAMPTPPMATPAQAAPPPPAPPVQAAPAASPAVPPAPPAPPADQPTATPGQPLLRAFNRGGAAAPTRVVPLVPSAQAQAPAPPSPAAALATPPPILPRPAIHVAGPLSPGRARLVLERGEGADGASFRLDAASVGAGRSQGELTFPADPCLAPHHATFFFRDGGLHVRDEGAPGGIYLRLRGPSVPIRPGDLFVVGDRLLRFAGPLPAAPTGPPDGTRRLGAPRPPSPTVVLEEWLEGSVMDRVFVRGGGSVTIGRSGCAVNLGDDPHLSQAHAELVLDSEGGARLRDLGSGSGTFVRVPARAERELHDGDWLRLGREVLRLVVG